MIKVTLVCNNCEEEFTLDESMEFPPYWIGIQMVIANKNGTLPSEDIVVHSCSQKCLVEYVQSNEFKEKITLIDKIIEDEEDGEEEDE